MLEFTLSEKKSAMNLSRGLETNECTEIHGLLPTPPTPPKYEVCLRKHPPAATATVDTKALPGKRRLIMHDDRRIYSTVPDGESQLSSSASEVEKLLMDLQREVDTLKGALDDYDRGNTCGHQTYEVIHPKIRSSSDKVWPLNLYNYATKNGFRYFSVFVDPKGGLCKRIVWFWVLVICLGLLTYQVFDRVRNFSRVEISSSMQIRHAHSLEFPAVTICNLNRFRITEASSLGLYDALLQYLNDSNVTKLAPHLGHSRLHDGRCMALMRNLSHSRQSLIHRCLWNGDPCESSDFVEVITEYGLCYRFQPRAHPAMVGKAGPLHGLSLLLNVEQYEYIQGARSAVGVRVSIHEPQATPRLWTDGINAAVGSHTSLGIHKIKHCNVSSLSSMWTFVPSYHSDVSSICQNNGRDGCDRQPVSTFCGTVHLQDSAHKGSESVNDCRRRGGKLGRDVQFDKTLSYSSLSAYAAESEVRLLARKPGLQRHFVRAMDIYHRANADIFQYDIAMLQRLSSGFQDIESLIQVFLNHTKKYGGRLYDAREVLREKIELLNDSVRMTLLLFNKSSHVSFLYFGVKAEDTLRQIADLGDPGRVQTMTPMQISRTLTVILRKLKILVVSRDYAGIRSFSLLQTIIRGVTGFREDIVEGYGQKYSEFRQTKNMYNKTTLSILNISFFLSESLSQEYIYLKNLSASENLKSKESLSVMRKALRSFFRFMKGTIINSVLPDLESNMTNLGSTYDSICFNITQFSDRLNSVMRTSETISSRLNRSFMQLQNLFSQLGTGLRGIHNRFETVKANYAVNSTKKSEMAQIIVSKQLWNSNTDTKVIVNELKLLIDEFIMLGTDLVARMSPLFQRLVDFNFANYNQLMELTNDLQLSPLTTELGNLTHFVVSTVQLTHSYKDELEEYLDNLKIDRKFYMNNFLRLDVYYPDVSETLIIQRPSYGIFEFTCDIGGLLALYLGASVLTLFEVIAFIGYAVTCYFGHGNSRLRDDNSNRIM